MEGTVSMVQLSEMEKKAETQDNFTEMQADTQKIHDEIQDRVQETQQILPEDILLSHEILRENLKRRTRQRKLFTDYKCKVCKKVFSDSSGLRNHEKIHNPERPYECSLCSYTAKTRKYLTRHVSLRHKGQPKKMECKQCGMKFMFKCLLDKHQRVHTGEKPNKCDFCGKAFSSRYSLRTHLFIHTNEKPYKCSFCDYACRDSSSLRKHHSTHLGLSMRYPCDQCPRRFDQKARLRTHVETAHLGIKHPKLTCDLCKSEYKTRASLISHIKGVHERANTCICGVCGKVVLNSANLAAHMLVHIDIRPFSCTYAGCKKKFKDMAAVKKHAIIHYPDQYMVCQHCGRTFTRKHRLEAHLKRFRVETGCRSNNHRRFYRKIPKAKTRKAKSGPFICDTCGYKTNSKRRLVDHIQFGHGQENDRDCKICHKTFRKNEYLQLHYMNNHSIKYTTKINKNVQLKPMVHIKQEPPDMEVHVEMELMDVAKEEVFEEYENKLFQYNLESWNRHEIESQGNTNKDLITEAQFITEDLFGAQTSNGNGVLNEEYAIDRNINDDSSYNGEETAIKSDGNEEVTNNGEESYNEGQETAFKANDGNDLIENSNDLHTETNEDMYAENKDNMQVTKTEAGMSREYSNNVSRKAMPVGEFLQHIILAEESDEDGETESQELLKRRVNELIQKTKLKNGIALKKNNFGRRLKKVDDDQLPDLMEKYLGSKKKEYVSLENSLVVPQKKSKDRTRTTTERDRKTKKKHKRRGKKLKSKSKDTPKDDKEANSKSKDPILNSNSMKLIFNMQQCYVCYKVFQTKPELIEHCKQHFDVCNEVMLKKCPFCPFVTHTQIKRHIRLKHKMNINFSFMKINDRKDNSAGSRYYFNIDDENVKQMEIVPSVKILNKKACMDLDRRNREIKDKSVLKRKLVKKGSEWVVQHEKLDVSKRIIPKLKGEQYYLERLRLLYLEKKKLGEKILFPCNNCTKVCQNLSALTLHMRRHDPDAKPYKPKVWKHKTKSGPSTDKNGGDHKIVVENTDNRTADPKPIVNNHRCDPKLMDFYKNNVKGGDIEFWQFLKIYNKMSKVNDFKDLDGVNAFGVEINDTEEVNDNDDNSGNNKDNDDSSGNNNDNDDNSGNNKDNDDSSGNNNENDDNSGSNNDGNVNDNDSDKNIKIRAVKRKSVKNKVSVENKRIKLGLTLEQYKSRCLAKAKMRNEIARRNKI